MYGLKERDLFYIRKAVDKFPEIDKAIIFGSRAIGNYKKSSDVDLAIIGNDVSYKTIVQLNEWLNDIYPIPYMFDIQYYNAITNNHLKQHIDDHGKEIT